MRIALQSETGDGKARGAVDIANIDKASNTASARFRRNPEGRGLPGG
jgi:hypothetical protein